MSATQPPVDPPGAAPSTVRPAAAQEPARRYARSAPVPHLTPAERAARGKAARVDAPLASHAVLDLPADRPDPVVLLERQATSRLPDLVPIRYGRMLTSPFAFYRGAALVQAADLARTPRSGLVVQLCGDAHLANFGVYASPERRLVFDINDFDETSPGPFEWDVKRLAGSFAVAARGNGLRRKQRREVVAVVGRAYRRTMRDLATKGNLAVWYEHADVDALLDELGDQLAPGQLKRTRAAMDKARARDSVHAYARLAELVDGRPRIVSAPPLVVPVAELFGPEHQERALDEIRDLLRSYRTTLQSDRSFLLEQFELVDLARKVVGVGSVGTRAWIALLLGRDASDPLFLQAKEAQRSVLEDFAGASAYTNAGERVVAGQHLMQATSDPFLGWQRATGFDGVTRDFYVRQLRDGKGSVNVERMKASGMTVYARLCGVTLARAHARSGDRIAIAAYLGAKDTFDQALVGFAESYADLTEQDHASLGAAVDSGRVAAVHGV